MLPDTSLPDLDAALIAGARATTTGGLPVSDGATLELRAENVARYASPAVVTDVWELPKTSNAPRSLPASALAASDALARLVTAADP